MTSMVGDSERIGRFRGELISAIPRYPDNQNSLWTLEAKHLTDLLMVYIRWRLRYVAARPRRVTGRSTLEGDSKAAALKAHIDAFVQAVEAGHDLTPYLSTLSHRKGYMPAAESPGSGTNTWADKDFVLNVMGLHHFHLDAATGTSGHRGGPDEMVFASVTRNSFEILGLFPHTAFRHDDDGTMTPERHRLWSIYEAREAAGALPGQLRMGGYAGLGITLSSQPVAVTFAAQRHARLIRDIEPKLDDPTYLRTLYREGAVPAKPKLKWQYWHLDFGLLDEASGSRTILEEGPN